MSSIIVTDSILAIDIGSITTQAALFDVVGSRYHFISAGTAPTTAGPPFSDVREGVNRAIHQLQAITGRTLLGTDASLLIPAQPDGRGIDKLVVTLSAGPGMRAVAVGLLENVSLESARNLATTTYADVVETISLNDRRKQDQRIDAILRARPDLMIVAGGVDDGAEHSVNKLLEAVGLACYLMPRSQRPQVLYAGNQTIRQAVQDAIAPITDLHIAPNIRPAIQNEELTPAQVQLAKIFKNIRARQMYGITDLDQWSQGKLLPASTAFGRIVRFLSHIYDPKKGVMGVDVGASAVTVAMALKGELALRVFSQLGLGENITHILNYMPVEQITRWLPESVSADTLRNYLHNKAAHPASLPATPSDLFIEQAVARQMLRLAAQKTTSSLPFQMARGGHKITPWTEPILASGSVISHAPTPGQSLLTILDGLQPAGITTIVLDQNNLLASLGAAAEVNPLLAVQVLESHAFLNLGTLIAPVGVARPRSPVLRVKAKLPDGNEIKQEIKFGRIEVIPLPQGQEAQLHLQPLNRFDIGMGGPGRGGRVQVVGGVLGIVIDARGRPIQLPSAPDKRQEAIQRWLWTLGN